MTTTGSYVHTTKDYSLFKPIDGNRNKNLLHLNRLKKSMSENYLFTILTVNENYEIIDGQHRFEIIKELGLPLNYVVCKGYGLNEVHTLNANAKTWKSSDYLEGYCNLGYKDYLIFRDFKEKYGLGHDETVCLLHGSKAIGGGSHVQEFYSGNFKVKDLKKAEDAMEKIKMIEPYYAGYKRRYFIYAMLNLFKNPNFQFTEFLQKLRLQPTALQDCVTTSAYIILIEEIYNYKRKGKVNLRFYNDN